MKKLIILLSILALNENKNKIFCDIKGNIKNPGVYEIKENYTIQNIIDDAGGLKKNSYTKNINLSKKVTDEMVIYIFTKEEIKESEKINECNCEPIYKYIECNEIEEDNKKHTTTTTIATTKEKTTTSTNTATITSTTITPTTKINTTTTKPIYENNSTTTKKVEDLIIININTATLEELTTINGLGIKKAQSIIDYRTKNGPFIIIEDILKVSGIGESTFEKIKEFIKV